MGYIVFLALLLLITLLGCYWIIESNRQKAIEAEKRRFNQRVKEINNDFKIKLIEFSEAKLIRPKNIGSLHQITSNYFVVQAHNEENLNQLEYISDLFINTVIAEASRLQSEAEHDQLADRLQYFMAQLPRNGIEFNKTFYQETFPSLVETIKFYPSIESIDDHQQSIAPQEIEDLNRQEQLTELT